MGKLFSVFLAVTWGFTVAAKNATDNRAAHLLLAETTCVSVVITSLRPKSDNALNQKLLRPKVDWEKKSSKAKEITQKEKLFAQYRATVMAILKTDAPGIYSQCEALAHIEEDCKKAHGKNTAETNRCIANGPKEHVDKIKEALTSSLK